MQDSERPRLFAGDFQEHRRQTTWTAARLGCTDKGFHDYGFRRRGPQVRKTHRSGLVGATCSDADGKVDSGIIHCSPAPSMGWPLEPIGAENSREAGACIAVRSVPLGTPGATSGDHAKNDRYAGPRNPGPLICQETTWNDRRQGPEAARNDGLKSRIAYCRRYRFSLARSQGTTSR